MSWPACSPARSWASFLAWKRQRYGWPWRRGMRHWRPSAKVNEHTDTGRGERAERLACMEFLLSLEIRFGFVEPESARTKLRAAATTTGTTKRKSLAGSEAHFFTGTVYHSGSGCEANLVLRRWMVSCGEIKGPP